jgi:hypothetical protein
MSDDLFKKKQQPPGEIVSLVKFALCDLREGIDLVSADFNFNFLPPQTAQPLALDLFSIKCPYIHDSEEQKRQNAYYEEHWPEYRDRAIQDLSSALIQREPIDSIELNDGRTLEVRSANYNDADNICTRDHIIYSVNAVAIGKENTSLFRIMSFADTPLEPLGYFFIKKYFENDEYSVYKDHEGQRFVGEVKFVYVSESQRGQHFGSIISSLASIEIIDDPSIEVLNLQVANDKVTKFLDALGFQPDGTAAYGYDNYMIDLTQDRGGVRKKFQSYIDKHSKNLKE